MDLPFAVVVTKSDLQDEAAREEAMTAATAWGRQHEAVDVLSISAVANLGLTELKHLMKRLHGTTTTGDTTS